jgi:multicomponent Na+:H+ antiporter subunit E
MKKLHRRQEAPPVSLLEAVLVRTLVLAALWWVLSGGSAYNWAVGGVTIVLALWISLKLAAPGTVRFSLPGALGFFGFFLLQSLKGGMQVGIMALRPRPDLRPAELDLALRLPTGPSQLFLAATLSLMPGTLALGVENDRLQLHVLDERMPIEHEVRSAEAWVARMFRQELQ